MLTTEWRGLLVGTRCFLTLIITDIHSNELFNTMVLLRLQAYTGMGNISILLFKRANAIIREGSDLLISRVWDGLLWKPNPHFSFPIIFVTCLIVGIHFKSQYIVMAIYHCSVPPTTTMKTIQWMVNFLTWTSCVYTCVLFHMYCI